jgi:signal transduction histidine kinase
MERRKILAHRRYLIIALIAILIPTLTLAVMQYLSAQRTEAQAHATLEANLDLHLLGIVDEAKRDLVDRASYITHSISHRRIRDRDEPGLARSFTRAVRRYPEISQLYAVFFERGNETGAWRALRYQPPDPSDRNTTRFKGVAVGSLVEDENATEALRRAWLAIPNRKDDATYVTFAPTSLADPTPRQIFFHPVYEPDHMNRESDLDRVGSIALTAEANKYPHSGYLRELVDRFDQRSRVSSSLGALVYRIRLKDEEGQARDLVSTGSPPGQFRSRGFEPGDRLFPNLTFEVALRDESTNEYASQFTGLSLLLGLGAAGLALAGLAMAWHATAREMRIAQMKSNFLASISHELKTPLTAIRAFGDLIRSGRTRDAKRIEQYGEMISYESDRLTALLNNILEISRLERDVRRYRLEQSDLTAAVTQIVDIFRATTRARGFEIKTELPALPIITRFDESALHQALLNLLSNAVNYSSDSRLIEVRVWRGETEASIEVRDFGIGVAPAEQRRIFDPFYRSSQPEVQSKSGTGLGLAIVREIASAHGGAVTVESKAETGTAFTLHLPLLTAEELSKPAAQEIFYDKDSGDRRRTERLGRLARQLGIRRIFSQNSR